MADQSSVEVFNKSLWKAPGVRRVSLSRWPRGALIKRPSEISEEKGFTVEVNSFLRNIGFLQKWPIHLLAENKDAWHLRYFNRGQVLLLDSTISEWIYIVKSGSISVLQKVQKVTAEEYDDLEQGWISLHGRHMRRVRNPNEGCKNSPRLNYMDQMKLNQQLEPENCIRDMQYNTDRLGLMNYEAINNDHHSKLEARSPNKKQILAIQNDLGGNSSSPQDHKLPELVSQTPVETQSFPPESDVAILSENRASNEILGNSQKGKHNIFRQKENSDDKAGSEAEPLFLLIQVLERGQNFNVSSLVFDDQPVLSVVSNGAECIMLCKNFFLEHATASCKETLKRTEYPYPSLLKMQENLQNHMKWVSFRADIYNEKVKMIESKKKKRKQCLPQYTGQYSHRTGPR